VKNSLTGKAETGASCTVALASGGCSNAWTTAGNIYLNIATKGVVANSGNNYGNALSVNFTTNLKTIGCTPSGLDWSAPDIGLKTSDGGVVLASGSKCTDLPWVSGSLAYYASSSNTYLGQLLFHRGTAAVSCV